MDNTNYLRPFFGKTHFKQFKEGKPELTNKVLSRCLKQMEDDELITKSISPDNSKDTQYSLTKKGYQLNKILFELAMYPLRADESNDIFDTETKNETTQIHHNWNKKHKHRIQTIHNRT